MRTLLTGSLFGGVSGSTGGQSPSQYAQIKSAIKSLVTERLRAVLRVRDVTTTIKGKWEVRIENRGALAESLSGTEQQLYENERSDVRS
jgi:siroheme synthase (precorrin-2 oxidase/ferrochelatase)